MSQFSFEIDPLKVLGVTADASLEQIRDAYRQKAKRYHPDAGGEDWIFRILSQSHELLCSARVVRATHFARPPTPPAARPRHEPELRDRAPGHPRQGRRSLARRGRRAPLRALPLGRRQLSLARPGRARAGAVPELQPEHQLARLRPDASRRRRSRARTEILAALAEIFDATIIGTRVINSRSHVENDRFAGWLSYSSFDRSYKALQGVHQALRHRGLGMRQWSRDLFLPRAWQFDRTEPPGGPRR